MSLDVCSYRDVFAGVGLESWYVAGCANCTALTTGAPTAGVLRAVPFLATGKDRTIDRLAMNVTTLLAGSARIGLYKNDLIGNLYPGTLVVDSGVIDTGTAGVKAVAVAATLVAGALYWAVHVGSAAPTLRCHALGGIENFLGISNAFGTAYNAGLSVAFAFAALPATFPAGAAMITAVPIPAVAVRFNT